MASIDPFQDYTNTCEGGEEFIAEAYHPGRCKNKDLHDKFIPINELKKSHFPKELQAEDFMDNIKVFAQLVVRIRVVGISKDRPDLYEDGSVFPHGRFKGNNRRGIFGSGYVHCPHRFPLMEEDCTCLSCVEAGESRLNRWYFLVSTSKHVVYDVSEAKKATFRCFFDEPEDKPQDKSQDKSQDEIDYYLYGVDHYPKRDAGYAKEEVCYVMCVTHDERLMNKWMQVFKERNKIFFKNPTLGFPLVILVSHPHGMSKKVTVGSFVEHKVPIGEEFPINKPIKFGTNTICNVPCQQMSKICWEDFFQAHGIDLCSQATETVDYKPSQHFKDGLLKFGGKVLIQHVSKDGSENLDVDFSVSIVDGRPKVTIHFIDGSTNNRKEVTPGAEDTLYVRFPPNSSFTLPTGAKYALRETDSSYKNFYAGTTYRFFDDMKSSPLPTEFKVFCEHYHSLGKDYYKAMSCPGSSGGGVIINIKSDRMFDVRPHGGAFGGGLKMCSVAIPNLNEIVQHGDKFDVFLILSLLHDSITRKYGKYILMEKIYVRLSGEKNNHIFSHEQSRMHKYLISLVYLFPDIFIENFKEKEGDEQNDCEKNDLQKPKTVIVTNEVNEQNDLEIIDLQKPKTVIVTNEVKDDTA